MMGMPLPWQTAQWDSLQRRRRDAVLPHALLLTGPEGVGKAQFAHGFAQSLLCEHPAEGGAPCGRCRACQLFQAGTHPDFLLVAPEETGKEIVIAQVRELVAYQTLTAQYGRHKVIIITPAERMNVNASNALLKTLEEPVAGTLVLLCSSRPALLLPTIRSRCQQLPFSAQTGEAVIAWLAAELACDREKAALLLAVAHGAPFQARALAGQEAALERRNSLFAGIEGVINGRDDPVLMAGSWQDMETQELLGWLHGCCIDIIRTKSAPEAYVDNPDLRQRLQALAEKVDLTHMFRSLDRLHEAMRSTRGQVNVQLLCEELLIGWSVSGKAARSG